MGRGREGIEGMTWGRRRENKRRWLGREEGRTRDRREGRKGGRETEKTKPKERRGTLTPE